MFFFSLVFIFFFESFVKTVGKRVDHTVLPKLTSKIMGERFFFWQSSICFCFFFKSQQIMFSFLRNPAGPQPLRLHSLAPGLRPHQAPDCGGSGPRSNWVSQKRKIIFVFSKKSQKVKNNEKKLCSLFLRTQRREGTYVPPLLCYYLCVEKKNTHTHTHTIGFEKHCNKKNTFTKFRNKNLSV